MKVNYSSEHFELHYKYKSLLDTPSKKPKTFLTPTDYAFGHSSATV